MQELSSIVMTMSNIMYVCMCVVYVASGGGDGSKK